MQSGRTGDHFASVNKGCEECQTQATHIYHRTQQQRLDSPAILNHLACKDQIQVGQTPPLSPPHSLVSNRNSSWGFHCFQLLLTAHGNRLSQWTLWKKQLVTLIQQLLLATLVSDVLLQITPRLKTWLTSVIKYCYVLFLKRTQALEQNVQTVSQCRAVQGRAGQESRAAQFSLSLYQALLLPTTVAVHSQRVKVGSTGWA